MSTRVLLRQVVLNHGRGLPSSRVGAVDNWLPLLPSKDVSDAMDRCTVVLPRPGDGWYAPPPSTLLGGQDGFPWGELCTAGVDEMKSAGKHLILSERHPQGAARAASEALKPQPPRRTMAEVMVRSLNLPCSIASAQALVVGAQDALRECSLATEAPLVYQRPVEVLLQQSEDLTMQFRPGMPEYPTLVGEGVHQVQALLQPMTQQLLEVADALPHDLGPDLARLVAENWEEACQVLFCLEGHGLIDPLGPDIAAKVVALRRFHFLRWTAPLLAGGPAAADVVVGPLLNALFRACDEAIEDSADAAIEDTAAPVCVYVSQAEALVGLLASLGMASAERVSSGWDKLTWPGCGESLELLLVQADGGEPFLQFLHDGEVLVPGLGRDVVPYDLVRERFAPSML